MKYILIIGSLLGLVWGQKMDPKKFMIMDDDRPSYSKKAEEAHYLDENRKAIYYWTKEINHKRIKDKAWAYTRRAMLYTELGQYDKAIADYTVLIRMGKKPSNFYYQRAKVRATAGDLGGAICDIDSAIALSKAPLTYFLARAEFKSLGGDLAGALADCQIAMDIQPTDGGSYFTRATIFLRDSNIHAACADFYRSHIYGYQDALPVFGCECQNYQPAYLVRAIPQAQLTVDGLPNWNNVPEFRPSSKHLSGHRDSCDFDLAAIKLAKNSRYLFVCLELTQPFSACASAGSDTTDWASLWLDCDNNYATGGETSVFQLHGFEQQLRLMQVADQLVLSLNYYNEYKKLQRNAYSSVAIDSLIFRKTANRIEFRVPLAQLQIEPNKPFRIIATEYERDNRPPFPDEYYFKNE